MKREKQNSSRLVSAIILFLLLGAGAGVSTTYADIVKQGEAFIPGHPGKVVKWTVRQRKTPGVSNGLSIWIDLELKNPQAGDDIWFVMCTMANVNKPKITQPSIRADINAGVWSCTSIGTEFWYPSYHFGCQRINLTAAFPARNVIDAHVQFSVDFEESDLAAPYFDLAIDCPGGFSGCGALFGAQNVFLTPGDGTFPGSPNGTSSWWVYSGGTYNVDPNMTLAQALFPTANWYTMAYRDQVYPSVLEGFVSNAPIGSLIEIEFPPSAQDTVLQYTVEADCVFVAIPFTITPGLAEEIDEHTYIRIIYPDTLEPQNPGAVIEFLGQVTATGATFFPGGDTLFAPGDFMHGVHIQFVIEDDLPYVVEQEFVRLTDSTYEISVTAADSTTMAIAASIRYTVNGETMPTIGIPFDDPAAEGEMTRFRGTVGVLAANSPIDFYEILLVDDAFNISVSSFIPTAVVADLGGQLPGEFRLNQNYPNPFNSNTTIEFDLPENTRVILRIYNILGQEVRRLIEASQSAGVKSIDWDGMDDGGNIVSSGIYLYRLETDHRIKSRKMLFLK